MVVPFEVYEHIGMVHEALGDKYQAREAYHQALETGADRLPDRVQQRIKEAIGRLSH
jgi:predicted negative regulator of RcsB-dependent stress response